MDIPALVQRQREFFRTGTTRPEAFRRQQLQRLRQALAEHEDALLTAVHHDLGKPPQEAWTAEIGLVLGEIDHALRHLGRWMKPRRARAPLLAWPSRGRVIPEPRGVALIIGPWNYPIQLVLAPLVAAIAGGNGAVVKPSEFAPHTAEALGRLIAATFPAEYISLRTGERELAEALLQERFDTIFFTGSTVVGRAVMAAAARHLTPVTLELGGKSPCLVCADAPPDLAARRIAWGKFMNAGQTCVAPDFVLVDHRIEAPFLEALERVIRQFYGDDPRRSPDYGRIVNRRHFDRLTGHLATGRIRVGGGHAAEDLYLAPTVLTDVPEDAPVMQEEIFGPILPVIGYHDLERTLDALAARPTPLALYVFTRDRATENRVLGRVRSGGVCVNDTVTHILGSSMPFGGLGESGLGAYHGRAGFEAFTHHRSVLRRSLAVDPPLRYPPPRMGLASLKRAMRFLLG